MNKKNKARMINGIKYRIRSIPRMIRLFFYPFDIQAFCLILIIACSFVTHYSEAGSWMQNTAIGIIGSAGVSFIIEMEQNKRFHIKRMLAFGHLFFEILSYIRYKKEGKRLIYENIKKHHGRKKDIRDKNNGIQWVRVHYIAQGGFEIIKEIESCYSKHYDLLTYKENLICSVILISYRDVLSVVAHYIDKPSTNKQTWIVIKEFEKMCYADRIKIGKELMTIDREISELAKFVKMDPVMGGI